MGSYPSIHQSPDLFFDTLDGEHFSCISGTLAKKIGHDIENFLLKPIDLYVDATASQKIFEVAASCFLANRLFFPGILQTRNWKYLPVIMRIDAFEYDKDCYKTKSKFVKTRIHVEIIKQKTSYQFTCLQNAQRNLDFVVSRIQNELKQIDGNYDPHLQNHLDNIHSVIFNYTSGQSEKEKFIEDYSCGKFNRILAKVVSVMQTKCSIKFDYKNQKMLNVEPTMLAECIICICNILLGINQNILLIHIYSNLQKNKLHLYIKPTCDPPSNVDVLNTAHQVWKPARLLIAYAHLDMLVHSNLMVDLSLPKRLSVHLSPMQTLVPNFGKGSPKSETVVKILVVDDQKATLKLLTHALTSDSICVYTANSAPDAIILFYSHLFPFILTDIEMGGFDGTHLAEIILKSCSLMKIDKPRICAMSATNLPIKKRYLFDEFWIKPVSKKNVLSYIDRVLF